MRGHADFMQRQGFQFSARDADQITQFVIDVFRPGDRVCDFCTQEFSETLAEPVHRHFHGPFGQVQMSGDLSVRSKADTSKRGRAFPELRWPGENRPAQP